MTVIQGQKSETNQISLFRWIEFVDKHMNFRDFEAGVASVTGLSVDQKEAMIEMLSTVQKTLDKRINIAGGKEAGCMAPGSLLKDFDPDLPSGNPAKRRVAWKCLPYFSLEAYHDTSEASSDSHPSRTLLQTRFPDNKRSRDMQQAVCHLPNVKDGYCFHIAQVWCLVLNNSLVITCSNSPLMSSNSQKGLCSDAISLIPLNHPLSSTNTATGTILILTNFNVTYSLPLKDCETWLDFISHFWELWSCYFQVVFKGKRVTSDNWPKLVALGRKGGLVLLLDDKKPDNKRPTRGTLLDEDDSDSQALGVGTNIKNTGGTSEEPSEGASIGSTTIASNDEAQARAVPPLPPIEETFKAHNQPPIPRQDLKTNRQSQDLTYGFHVFIWLNSENLVSGEVGSRTDENTLSTNEAKLRTDLEEIVVFLSKKAGTTNCHAFRCCPSQNRREVHDQILKEVKNGSLGHTIDQVERERFENKVEIWNKLSKLFQFFLPHNFEGPTTDKFWGAVAQILDVVSPQKLVQSTLYLDEGKITEILDVLKKVTDIIEPFLNYIQLISVTNLIGKECPEEFPRAWAHLLMFLILSSTNDTAGFSRQSGLCLKMLENGMRSIAQDMSSKKLEDSRTFGPSEMVNLMHLQLLKDYTPNSVDISETYRQHLNKLESAMDENPLDRRHQRSLDYLLEEIAAIEGTISEQRDTLVDGDDYLRTLPDKRAKKLEPHATDKIGISLMFDRTTLISRRLDQFQKMREKVQELKNLNTQKIETNKDGQEKAIYAFTVVTIIFLPLGTVAGILGMNTTDVRNMNQSQWVFWVTALPLIVITIALCLIWTGKTDSFWNEARKLWSGKIPWPNISVSMRKSHPSYGYLNSRQDLPIREAEARIESQIEWLKDRKKYLRASQLSDRDVSSEYKSYDRLGEYDQSFQRGVARGRTPIYPVQRMALQQDPVGILEPPYLRRYRERNQQQYLDKTSPRIVERDRRRRETYIDADEALDFQTRNPFHPEDKYEREEKIVHDRRHFSPSVVHRRNPEFNPNWEDRNYDYPRPYVV